MRKSQRKSVFTAFLWIITVPLSCAWEGHETDSFLGDEQECIIFEGLCGGCDPTCRQITDTPSRAEDVDTDGEDANGEDVAYDPAAEGIVIGTGYGSGPDSDGDGLPDSSDPAPEDPHGDADHDGVPDAYEVFLGTNPLVSDPAPPDDHWYFVLPHDGTPVLRDIPPDIPLTVRSADIYLLMDVTGSMGGEIANLRSTISSYIIPEIDALIDDASFGVGRFGDYPYASYPIDDPFTNMLNITDDIPLVQTTVNSIPLHWGADWAESQTTALWQIASGSGIRCGSAASTCPSGTSGYPCFRTEAQPIVIIFTDAPFHLGVLDTMGSWTAPDYNYTNPSSYSCLPTVSTIPTLEEAVAALNAIGAKVISVYSGYAYGQLGHVSLWSSYYRELYPDPGLEYVLDPWYLGVETESVDADGYPFLYAIPGDGTGLGAEVVNAVNDLVDTMLLQVNSRWSDTDPASPDGSVLIQDVDPVSCSHCASLDSTANMAIDVYPGSNVTFQVHLENTAIPPGPEPQEFELRIEILNNDTALLAERTIHVLVPGEHGLNVPLEQGRYWQTWDARTTCGGVDEYPEWDQLYFDTTTPPGTDITFVVRTSDSFAGLDSATPVTTAFIPEDESPVALDYALENAGVANGQRYLRLEAILHTDDVAITPVLHETRTLFYCLASEP